MGAPRVGNQAFVDFMHQKLGTRNIKRVVYKKDPIAISPPLLFKYRHAGSEVIRFDSVDKCHIEPASNDKKSVNPLRTRRIKDHTFYGKLLLN